MMAPQKESFAKRVTLDKPSPPSRMATKAITASNVASAVVMPAVEEFNDLPASGSAKSGALRWMEDYFVNRDFVRTCTSKWGSKGRDGKGIAYTSIAPDSISSLKGTSGGSRLDLALVAAFKQKPTTVFLIADGEPGTRRGNQAMRKKAIVDLIESEAKIIYGSGPKPKVNCISVKGIGEVVLKDIASRFKGKYKAIDPNKI
jgi:hypothetical protein